MTSRHYKGGGYFPRGGSSSIAKTLTAAIERRGGHVFALSPVEKILTKKNMLRQYVAVGVRVRGEDILVNNFVVSDAGFLATFGIDNDGVINKPVLVDGTSLGIPHIGAHDARVKAWRMERLPIIILPCGLIGKLLICCCCQRMTCHCNTKLPYLRIENIQPSSSNQQQQQKN